MTFITDAFAKDTQVTIRQATGKLGFCGACRQHRPDAVRRAEQGRTPRKSLRFHISWRGAALTAEVGLEVIANKLKNDPQSSTAKRARKFFTAKEINALVGSGT